MTDTAQAKWAAAFVKAQADMPPIPKNKKATIKMKEGGSFSYTYADLPDIIEKVRPILAANGLAIGQSTEGSNGSLALFTRIYHEAGHVETFGPVVLPSGGDARAAGSAITYARRYGLCAALNIAADEDDDGAQVSAGSTASRQTSATPVAPQPSVSPNSWGEEETGGSPAPGGSGPSSSSLDWRELCDRYGKAVVLRTARDTAKDLKITPLPSKAEDLYEIKDARVLENTAAILAERLVRT